MTCIAKGANYLKVNPYLGK